MGKKFLHTRSFPILLLLLPGIALLSFRPQVGKTGKVRIHFVNTANGKDIVLRDSVYQNPFGESYTITKLKYYISHFAVPGAAQLPEADPYQLINAADEAGNSFEITLQPGNYNGFEFFLGVDSARNCSGAQTGALDPMNDMFWTWNSGYVMFKLEGSSPSSTADLRRIEHHVGGYKGANNVITKINLPLPGTQKLEIKEGEVTDVFIEMNLDHYWKGREDIKISDHAVCMTTGALAKKLAANFSTLFSVKEIVNK